MDESSSVRSFVWLMGRVSLSCGGSRRLRGGRSLTQIYGNGLLRPTGVGEGEGEEEREMEMDNGE